MLVSGASVCPCTIQALLTKIYANTTMLDNQNIPPSESWDTIQTLMDCSHYINNNQIVVMHNKNLCRFFYSCFLIPHASWGLILIKNSTMNWQDQIYLTLVL